MKPHPAQTFGGIVMDQEGGVGVAICAAYQEGFYLEYFVCRIPDGMTAEEATCLYNHNKSMCYQCGGVGKGFNLTSTSVSVLGMKTSSCLVNVWVVGQYMCLAQRLWNGTSSMFQLIGSFNTSKPVPEPTSQPAVGMCNVDTSLRNGLVGESVALFIFVVLATLACSCVCCCHRKKSKKEQESLCKLYKGAHCLCVCVVQIMRAGV